MTDTVLWYLHDHGRGHLQRALAVLPHLRSQVVLAAGPGVDLGSVTNLGWDTVDLPSDVPVGMVPPTRGPWHYAPAVSAVRERGLAIAGAVERYGCTTAVVDVSAEVTVLARLLGLRVVATRQSGRRTDAAHGLAFGSSDRVWVPQHRDLEPIVDEAVDDRWEFTGAFSRFDGRVGSSRSSDGDRSAVLMVGAGGHSFAPEHWVTAAAPVGWSVTIIGADVPVTSSGLGVEMLGHVDDAFDVLSSADVVICSAGWGAVTDVVAVGARLVVVAESRPFDEQRVRAETLAERKLALHLPNWPRPDDLGPILERAMSLDLTRWRSFHDGQGAVRAAAMIDGIHGS